jgi:hypothetical protein
MTAFFGFVVIVGQATATYAFAGTTALFMLVTVLPSVTDVDADGDVMTAVQEMID